MSRTLHVAAGWSLRRVRLGRMRGGRLGITLVGALLAAPLFSGPLAVAASAQQTSKPSSGSGSTASSSKAPAKSTKKPRKRVRRARGQQAPTTDRIKEIQQVLVREGHLQGDSAVSGKWDAATIEALRSYQQANGLTPTGKLDARTLQKLGLGSEVAGQAAPRPSAATAERADPARP